MCVCEFLSEVVFVYVCVSHVWGKSRGGRWVGHTHTHRGTDWPNWTQSQAGDQHPDCLCVCVCVYAASHTIASRCWAGGGKQSPSSTSAAWRLVWSSCSKGRHQEVRLIRTGSTDSAIVFPSQNFHIYFPCFFNCNDLDE